MSAQHTPGPWFLSTDDGVWVECDKSYGRMGICVVTAYCNAEGGPVERIANARLISAAPCQLKANERAERFLSGLLADEIVDDASEVLSELRAAITKATGK